MIGQQFSNLNEIMYNLFNIYYKVLLYDTERHQMRVRVGPSSG